MGNKLITPEEKNLEKHFMKVTDPVSVRGWSVISDSIEATGENTTIFLETCGDAWLNHFKLCIFALNGKAQILVSPDFGDLYDVTEIEDIVKDTCLGEYNIKEEILKTFEQHNYYRWINWDDVDTLPKNPYYSPYITDTNTSITC